MRYHPDKHFGSSSEADAISGSSRTHCYSSVHDNSNSRSSIDSNRSSNSNSRSSICDDGSDSGSGDVGNKVRKFQEIQEAYAVLGKKWKRALYDQELQHKDDMHPTGSTAEDWKHIWETETDEQKVVRRTRYQRYANEERTDLPPRPLSKIWQLAAFLASVLGAVVALANCLQNMNENTETDIDDHFEESAYVNKRIKRVKAYHDPFANVWRRIADGYEAPSPAALTQYYVETHPAIDTSDVRVPKQCLTVIDQVLFRTQHAPLLYDPRNSELVSIRNTINEARTSQ